jgi:hypothetical protein
MNPSASRVATRHLKGRDEFAGIDVRPWSKRLVATREKWWDDMEAFLREWWSFSSGVKVRKTRGKLEFTVPSRGPQRDIHITVKGTPLKPTVYVWAAEKTFGPNDSLETIMYWIDSITRPGASASSWR